MARYFKKREELLGEAPGSLIFVGTQKIENPMIDLIKYNETDCKVFPDTSLKELENLMNEDVLWVNITGIHDSNFIKEIGEYFSIHSLILEDIMNTAQRAKYEEFDEFAFTAIKMLKYDENKEHITAEQISILHKGNLIITFQEEYGDVFSDVRERIKKAKGIVRNEGSDYLYYILVDTIVENYVRITEKFGEKIDDLELKLLESTSNIYLQSINNYKKELNYLNKVIKPVKELLIKYLKSEENENNKKIIPFKRDLQDLFHHTLESVDTYRDVLNDYLSIYHSNLNIKMNDIVRVLTIFSAIFIPVTFLAGVYGMNFENLPELSFKYSYLIFWIVVILSTSGLFIYFRHKKWL
jgi:magnesium transporter